MKQRIIRSFTELASERGFSRVTMDELAVRASMSKRTIYRYFSSKEEIVDFILTRYIASVEDQVQQAWSSSKEPAGKVRNLVEVISENLKTIQPLVLYDLQKYYPRLWDKLEQFRAEKIQKLFEDILVSNERGYFRPVNPKIFISMLMASVKEIVNPVFIMENNITLEEAIKSLFEILLYGVVRQEGSSGDLTIKR